MSVSKFVDEYMPAAIAAGEKIGVSPHILLGQWGLETGWGKSVIPGTYNLGNIKAGKSWQGPTVTAKDNHNGSVDPYRAYESPEAFADDYIKLVTTSNRYKAAIGAGNDPVEYATRLKKGGYAEDEQYVAKMSKASAMTQNAILGKIGANIVQDLRNGASPDEVVMALRNSPTIGADVSEALKQGKSIDRILEVAGGSAYQDYVKSKPTHGMGAVQKGIVGVGKAMQETIDGTKELYHAATGNEKALAEDRARTAERQKLDAPLMETAAGKVGYVAGKALPYVAASALTGGASLLPQVAVQGTVGAVDGLTTPTTKDGERFDNAVKGALWAGGGTVAGYGAGKLIGNALSKFGASADDAALIEQRIAAAKAQGLPVSASNLTNTGKAIAENLSDDASVAAFRTKVDQALAGKVGERLGVQGAEAIDSNLLNAADPYRHINPILDKASVNITPQMVNDVAAALPSNPLTHGISTNSTVRRAAANLAQAQQSGQAVPARALQELNSELKQLAASNAVSAGERKAAGEIDSHINNAINSALTPEQQAAYRLANEQFRNMKAVEQMVRSSYDSGTVTPRQMMIAAKSGRFKNAFSAGEAPYQDLAGTAMDLYGPASGRGIGSELAKSIGRNLDTGMMYHAALNPTTGVPAYLAKKAASSLLGKAVTSENPTVIKVLTGTTDIQKKLADPSFRKMLAKLMASSGSASSALNRKDKDK